LAANIRVQFPMAAPKINTSTRLRCLFLLAVFFAIPD
jgi:hypothetical protein